jgi:hypothetical protein
MSHRIGASVDEDLRRALDEAAHQARTSQAEIIRYSLREQLLSGGSEGSEYDFEIPDHLRKQLEREKRKERNKTTWHKLYFPQWVDDKFHELFKKGVLPNPIYPDAVEDVVEMYCDDARGIYDDPEVREAAIEWVEDYAGMVVEADDVSDFDALDPQSMFEEYTGVKQGREKEQAAESIDELVEDAFDLITDDVGGTLGENALDPEKAVEILQNRSDVPEGFAETAVDRAVERLDGGGR